MILLFSLLWLLAIILLIADWRRETNRWLSAVAFFSGCGSLSVILEAYSLPVVNYFDGVNNVLTSASTIGFLSSLSHHMAPYALLIYGMSNTLLFQELLHHWKNRLKLILLIPPLVMHFMFPFKGGYDPSFLVLSLWATPYIMGANLLLILSFFRARNEEIRQQKLLNCIIVSPITLYALLSNYILRIFNNHEAWLFHRWFIVIQFSLFVFFSVRYGALGVKIRFEKLHLERTRKSISSGTAIISHTIKNEITKISMCSDYIKDNCKDPNEYVTNSLDIIRESINHLQAMVSRINDQMSDIELKKSKNSINEICDAALMMVTASLESKNIIVAKKYSGASVIDCDEVHIKEVLINIFKNAIEAMEIGGKIEISLEEGSKATVLSIKDSGKGIPKENLEKVLEPFFTTKKHTLNFGLGLSYCDNVMRKHGGKLELHSKEGEGTTIVLSFPTKERPIKFRPIRRMLTSNRI
ncbi:sensor histidine kinase [Alkaliphilus transvaalensis]|uniref:sensor histidine kinase n=1 Tax=Alkaliphilus transvaalensis TaxID=114628 RepID=UPI00047D792C|nr:HAMP domain-containing sensor histidine kinase [Alkaliphilus transvaalensis]